MGICHTFLKGFFWLGNPVMVKMQSPHSTIKSKSSPLTSCSTLDSSLPSYLWCIGELLTVQSTTTQPSTRKVPFSLLEMAAAHKKATHTASLKNKQNNHPFTPYIFIKQTLYARHCSKHGYPTQHRIAMLLIWLWAQNSVVWGPFTHEPPLAPSISGLWLW